MSWEAYRWTAKSPSELYHVLGPHGVDELIRQALSTCWRESPPEGRSLASVRRIAQEVFDRNMNVWAKIKQPSPAAFFENLLPGAADGFVRQAMVLCWMMMPRAGGRHVADVRRIVGEIWDRNLAAWQADEGTFTGSGAKRAEKKKASTAARKPKAAPKVAAAKRPAARTGRKKATRKK